MDFTDLHAWCEVYLPGAGWIGLDPTSGMLAGEGHLPVACTPEPTTAAPISGVVDDCEVEFGHAMQVTRIYEAPRVTKPYTENQWRALDGLGRKVDADLTAMDVRLTQGGEPTFVSIDDRDGAEWNTDALGPTKRVHAFDLLLRLKERYGRGGFVHFGQGKWYPGEQLPRWALSILWRADGESCWNDPRLLADERAPATHTIADAERFIRRLAQRLGVDAGYVLPGYEDAWYYLWRERGLPPNVDPFESRLDDELERARLRARLRPGARVHDRFRLAAGVRTRRRPRAALDQRTVVSAGRPDVPDPRRLADGLSAAARLAPVGGQARAAVARRERSVRAARSIALACGHPRGLRAPCGGRRLRRRRRGRAAGGVRAAGR